jgi:hypothetical protein
MAYILTADGQSYRLTGSRELGPEVPINFGDRARAVNFLRMFLGVPSSMRALRTALTNESSMNGNKTGKITDQKVIEEISTLLLQGRLQITSISSMPSGLTSGTLSTTFSLRTFPIEPVSEKAQVQIRRFGERLQGAYELSARDLAAGRTSKELDEKTFIPALSDLMADLPLSGSLLGTVLGKSLGLSKDQMALSPKELGDDAGERAINFIDSLRENKPDLYWPAAVSAGMGAGALSYAQGSQVLGYVGLDPEFSKKFLDDKISIKGEASWGAELSDPKATLTSKQWLTKNLSLYQSATASAPELSKLGLSKYSLGMDYKVPLTNPDNSLNIGSSYLRDMEADRGIISSYLKGKTKNSTYGLESKYDHMNSDYSVTGYYGKQLGWGTSFEGYASHQDWNDVESSGVGLRLVKRF